jgi:DNA-directed RNA polymerase beta subunit
VLVNKYSPINQTDISEGGGYNPNKQEYKHTKLTYKGAVEATVDKVMITSNEHENFIIKVVRGNFCIRNRIVRMKLC